MQSVYLQRIMKKNANMGPKKQSQNKPNFTPQGGRIEVRCRMPEITCLWQLQLKTDFDIIIEL